MEFSERYLSLVCDIVERSEDFNATQKQAMKYALDKMKIVTSIVEKVIKKNK